MNWKSIAKAAFVTLAVIYASTHVEAIRKVVYGSQQPEPLA